MNFYLADDTIEIKEKVVQNNGKDPYPLLLKRGKVKIIYFSYQNNQFILIIQEWHLKKKNSILLKILFAEEI